MIELKPVNEMADNEKETMLTKYLNYSTDEVMCMSKDEIDDIIDECIYEFENSDSYLSVIDKVEDAENIFAGDQVEMSIFEILESLDEEDDFDIMYPNGRDDEDE